MERSTKIYLGVGAAALIAFLLLRNKAAAQKTTTDTTTGGTTTGGGSKDEPCPAGQTRVQLQCIKAPCGSMCMPDKFDLPTTPPNPIFIGIDTPAPPANIDDVLPAPLPTPVSNPLFNKFPVYTGGEIYDGVDMGGGIAGKVGNQELYL